MKGNMIMKPLLIVSIVAASLFMYACSASSGADGADGANGINGAPGLPGLAGLSGEPGAPGAPGLPGEPGAAGAPGNPGANGIDGEDGADGQSGSTSGLLAMGDGGTSTIEWKRNASSISVNLVGSGFSSGAEITITAVNSAGFAKNVVGVDKSGISSLKADSAGSFESNISLPTSSFSWVDEDDNGIYPIAITASGGGDVANAAAIVVDAIPGN